MKKTSGKNRGVWEELVTPDFDETALFSISYILLLIFFVNNPPSTWDLSNISFHIEGFESYVFIIFFMIFILGMGLCIYHAFSNRKKTEVEKHLMLVFAAFTCAFSGIWGATYMLLNSSGWITIFPIWNLITSYILLGAPKAQTLGENFISDENVSLIEVVLSTIFVSSIFFICYIYFKLNWAATFSICIVWATTFNNTINSLLLRKEIKTV